ncbi:rhamnogalacturonan acetylesterase [Aeoliella mucimassa]|uniref:Rhamnogalacturonan acetylesterase RhgT n=1 Tax=Aeoliella mucimassa TaxID=2527972 RepID=A0A518AQ28_9BACT|nr:rhamnogalacturonan acetylesterase [Aeoliella mucimassa]QDU56827.1 Rhamnogalacturonan acetylesterase RhgT [Aeoliella mucimassa]
MNNPPANGFSTQGLSDPTYGPRTLLSMVRTTATLLVFALSLILLVDHSIATDLPDPVKIVLVGDSTVSEYPEKVTTRGWGQYLEQGFKQGTVDVINLAASGRSTKTFITEGRWTKALATEPTYVFIQFGHNDSHAPERPEATNPATDYKQFLRRYIEESREIEAVPVLVTPMVRRAFDAEGKIIENLTPLNRPLSEYAKAMLEIAKEMDVPVIDLQTSSKELAEKIGPDESKQMASKPGDITHFNAKGAEAIANLVIADIEETVPALASYLKQRKAATE